MYFYSAKLRIRAVRSVFGPRTKSQKVTSGIETIVTSGFPYSVALCESRAASNPSARPYAVADNKARLVFAKALAFPKAAHDDDNDDTVHIVIATLQINKLNFRLSC